MLVDSHAHLDDPRFDADRAAVIQRAWDAGVRRILTIGNGTGPDDMGCGVPLAAAHDWIYTSAGVHPHDASKFEGRHRARLQELAAHPRVVAVGEIGLDYHYDHSPREVQRRVFQEQLAVAVELDKPVIIHTREADADTMEILREQRPRRGIIHCFTSGPDFFEFALESGFMISFSGIVTFPRADALVRLARQVPADRLLIETDSPYLAPVPHRGKRNEPAFAADTLRFLAAARGVSADQLAHETASNFARLFSLSETS